MLDGDGMGLWNGGRVNRECANAVKRCVVMGDADHGGGSIIGCLRWGARTCIHVIACLLEL